MDTYSTLPVIEEEANESLEETMNNLEYGESVHDEELGATINSMQSNPGAPQAREEFDAKLAAGTLTASDMKSYFKNNKGTPEEEADGRPWADIITNPDGTTYELLLNGDKVMPGEVDPVDGNRYMGNEIDQQKDFENMMREMEDAGVDLSFLD